MSTNGIFASSDGEAHFLFQKVPANRTLALGLEVLEELEANNGVELIPEGHYQRVVVRTISSQVNLNGESHLRLNSAAISDSDVCGGHWDLERWGFMPRLFRDFPLRFTLIWPITVNLTLPDFY